MSSNKGKFTISPVSKATPFDNSTNGFTATDAQGAIEEAKALAANASRGGLICSHDGAAAVGRYLAFSYNNPSSTNPMVIPEPSQLVAISLSAATVSTGTITIYKNGVSVITISVTSARKSKVSSLAIDLTDLDELSVAVTVGSVSKPMVTLFIRTL